MISLGTESRVRTQSMTVFHRDMLNFVALPKNKAQASCLLLCISHIPRKCLIQALTLAALSASSGNSQVMRLFTA